MSSGSSSRPRPRIAAAALRVDTKHRRSTATMASSSSLSLSSSMQSSTTSTSLAPEGRRACGCYVWNAPSAFFSRWCNHLLQGCVYEGRAGHKYVRIQPGSILQLLYPCTRFSTDQCLLCGGQFRDHLRLWWYPQHYSPYDQYINQVANEGVRDSTIQVPVLTKTGKGRKKKTVVKYYTKNERDFVFHHRYVVDLDNILKSAKTPSDRRRILAQQAKGVRKWQIRAPLVGDDDVRPYLVPASGLPPKEPSATMRLCRAVVLQSVDRLIRFEAVDKKRFMDESK